MEAAPHGNAKLYAPPPMVRLADPAYDLRRVQRALFPILERVMSKETESAPARRPSEQDFHVKLGPSPAWPEESSSAVPAGQGKAAP